MDGHTNGCGTPHATVRIDESGENSSIALGGDRSSCTLTIEQDRSLAIAVLPAPFMDGLLNCPSAARDAGLRFALLRLHVPK